MARTTKCPGCGLSFDRDQIAFVHIKNRYWHKACFESENEKISKDVQDLKVLEDYIMKLFNADFIDARIRLQLKNMMASYGYSYSGIHKTLVFWYDVKGNSINKANGGLGIIPYVYEDAKKYFYTVYMARAQNKDKAACEYVTKGRTIKITPPERKVKQKRLVDLDALEEVENGK